MNMTNCWTVHTDDGRRSVPFATIPTAWSWMHRNGFQDDDPKAAGYARIRRDWAPAAAVVG